MSAHIAITSAAISMSAGIYGYAKTRSRPSLLGGLALSFMFASAGILIDKTDEKLGGHAIAAAAGTLALVIGTKRLIASNYKPGVGPVTLLFVGAMNVPYQYMKAWEWYNAS